MGKKLVTGFLSTTIILGALVFFATSSNAAGVTATKHHKQKHMQISLGAGCTRQVGGSNFVDTDVQVVRLPSYRALRGAVVKVAFVDVLPEDGDGVVRPDSWTRTTNSKGWTRITFQFAPPSFNFRMDYTVSKKGYKRKKLSSNIGLYPGNSPDGCPPLVH